MANAPAVKTDRMVCNLTEHTVTYIAQKLYVDTTGKDTWEDTDSRVFAINPVDLSYTDGETRVNLAAYGLRALLADRTSQFRKLGPKAVLEGMDAYYANLLEGNWKMARTASGGKKIDMILVELIAGKKNCPLATAEEMIKKATPEMVAALIAKFADEYEALKAKAEEADFDLDDLLADEEA
jgi:hypothetical protein